jgi:hypothetical protein
MYHILASVIKKLEDDHHRNFHLQMTQSTEKSRENLKVFYLTGIKLNYINKMINKMSPL